jgi:hypothetical protein
MLPSGIAYVVPAPGAPAAFASGRMRSSLPRRSFVLAEVLRAS